MHLKQNNGLKCIYFLVEMDARECNVSFQSIIFTVTHSGNRIIMANILDPVLWAACGIHIIAVFVIEHSRLRWMSVDVSSYIFVMYIPALTIFRNIGSSIVFIFTIPSMKWKITAMLDEFNGWINSWITIRNSAANLMSERQQHTTLPCIYIHRVYSVYFPSSISFNIKDYGLCVN